MKFCSHLARFQSWLHQYLAVWTLGKLPNYPLLQAPHLLFSCSVMSHSLWPHGLQHTRLSCLSLSLGACSNSCPSSQRCHPTLSSSVNPFSSCLQSFPALFSNELALCIRWLKYWASVSASVLMNIQGWFPLELPGLISLQSKGLSRSSLAQQLKSINSSVLSLLYGPTITSIHDYWKNHRFD